MGSGQSVHSTHLSRQTSKPLQKEQLQDSHEHHISISNKMVERLVEDATIAGGAAAAPPAPRGGYKEKIFMEKMRCLDESHSEKYKITMEDLDALARRIEMRTANMVAVEPVCEECSRRVVACYSRGAGDPVRCSEAVDAFTRCVREAAQARLRARTAKEARELARRERHVAHAREQTVLLGPAPEG